MQDPRLKLFFPSTWGTYNYRYSFLIGFMLGFPIAFILFCFNFFGLSSDQIFDFILFLIGLLGITIIAFFSYRKGWDNNRAWIAIALIIVFAAIPILGINYNLKKAELPIQKLSVCNCTVCFSTGVQQQIGLLSPGCVDSNTKLPIQEIFQEISWDKEYQETIEYIKKYKQGDLLNLCCSNSSDVFLQRLYLRNKKEIEESIIPLIEKINSSTISDSLKNSIIELQIFDCLGLQAFNKAFQESSLFNCCPNKRCVPNSN